MQDEALLEGEIVLDEVYVKLVGLKEEEPLLTDDTIKNMITKKSS
jgi:predicted CopG family antitoxin